MLGRLRVRRQTAPVSAKIVREMIDRGVTAIWLPVFNHAITLSTVGTYRRVIDGDNANGWHGPLPWDKAVTLGHYDLDADGELKKEIKEIVRICADRNVALFFGHATHKEIYKLAEEVEKVGLKRAVIDHPFSPFLNVSPEMMKELSPVGIFSNFTWDELSPLLGVDPQIMYNTIRDVGPEHFTLSSDAGEPLFPDSVEAMRLVRAIWKRSVFRKRSSIRCVRGIRRGGRAGTTLMQPRGSRFNVQRSRKRRGNSPNLGTFNPRSSASTQLS